MYVCQGCRALQAVVGLAVCRGGRQSLQGGGRTCRSWVQCQLGEVLAGELVEEVVRQLVLSVLIS